MILIFFGPPGAGKGTQASLISNKLYIPHISTGEILRKKLLDADLLSLKIKKVIDSGNLVSDDILNKLVSNRLNNLDCKNGFILDGYPRTLSQNNYLEEYLKNKKLHISNIFELFIDKEVIVKRINFRSNIENRQDDKEEIIKIRIKKYAEETRPLSDYYSLNYSENYNVINGNQEIEMIQEDILKIVKKWGFSMINTCFLTWLLC